MLKRVKQKKNYLNCNNLIASGMLKRRRLAIAAILNICNIDTKMRIIK